MNGIFIFAVVWSFGAAVDTDSRRPFDISFKRLINGDPSQSKKRKNISYPEKASLFDFQFHVK